MKTLNAISEKELLLRLQDGDHGAFEVIYEMFQPALVFFANRLLFSAHLLEAEEVVQDSLLKFYDRRYSFGTLTQIKSFLYICTKNACLKHIAKEKVRQHRHGKIAGTFQEAEDYVWNEIIHAEAVRQLHAEIDKLPEKCKEIMQKLISDGMSANEIAEELNITVSTVNSQKARAVALLRKRLSGAGLLLLFIHI